MKWNRVIRALVLALLVQTAAVSIGFSESVAAPTQDGPIPLVPSDGARAPRIYPSLGLGIGLRGSKVDFSGLDEVYGGNPPFALSPIISGVVELDITRELALQVDAGFCPAGYRSYEAMAGPVIYLRASSTSFLQASFTSGPCLFSFNGPKTGRVTEAGATGFFAGAGLQLLEGSGAIEIFVAYFHYPQLSTTYTINSGPESQEIKVKLDCSHITIGIRIKGFS